MQTKLVNSLQEGRGRWVLSGIGLVGALLFLFVFLFLAGVKSPLLAKDARNGAPPSTASSSTSTSASTSDQKYPPTIVFMTDFGVVDDSVALCRGVMYSIMPEVRIVDLTHQVTPFSILDGARFLYGT